MPAIVNKTPFDVLPLAGRIEYPQHSLTLIVKGSFRLVPDGTAVPDDEQTPIGPDVWEDDNPAGGKLRYDSDLVHDKPEADLLLVGQVHAPGARPVDSCRVSFGVGGTRHSLRVSGDREWSKGLLKAKPTEPRAFREMELSYAHSFGGEGFQPNPIGKGCAPPKGGSNRTPQLLPNIETPGETITSPTQTVSPAGFGPLPRIWEPRASAIGTYGKRWLRTRCPWYPQDIDPRVFNSAPEPLRVAGFLRGDEEIFLENLHPEHPRYRSQLPGLAVRGFLHEWPATPRVRDPQTREEWFEAWRAGQFREVEMKLDTLWIDAEQERLVLVWRGHAPVASDELEEVQHLFVLAEPLEEQRTRDACRALLLGTIIEEPAAEAEDDAAPAAASESPVAAEDADAGDALEEEQAETRLAVSMAALPPGLRPVDDGTGTMDPGLTRFFETGGDPPMDEGAELRAATALGELGIEMEVEQADALAGRATSAAGAIPMIEPEAENSPETDMAGGPWTREAVEQQLARGLSLAEEDLSGLDLSGLDLSDAVLAGATLDRADLTGCDLSRASFVDASLKQAILAGASGDDVDLSFADLSEADCARADLSGANLRAVNLKSANLYKTRLEEATVIQANLFRAQLQFADLRGADMRGSNLYGADLSDTRLEGARTDDAILHQTRLEPDETE